MAVEMKIKIFLALAAFKKSLDNLDLFLKS